MYSRFWTMIDDHANENNSEDTMESSLSRSASQQYAYRGMNVNGTVKKLAALAIPSGQDEEDDDDTEEDDESDEERDLVNGYIGSSTKKLVWSEPLAPMNDREDAANSQGISFPSTSRVYIHVLLMCEPQWLSDHQPIECNAVLQSTGRTSSVHQHSRTPK